MTPKISIILPTYNGKKYLKQSVESIFAQTYTNWELILVDDCSTDGTDTIVDQCVQADSRVRSIHNKENKKLPKSLNIGFSMAKGEYFTWTSDDNIYMPDALAIMMDYLDSHPDIYMVCCNMQIIDENGNVIDIADNYSTKKMYVHNCLGACFMYRKEVHTKVGNYDEQLFCVEDYDYWLRILEEFGQIVRINKILYKYRRHEHSLTELRQKQISDQLTRMRVRYIDRIFKVLDKDNKQLCRIYYEMINSQYMTQKVIDCFKRMLPELSGEVPFSWDKNYIIFAAGKYGESAAKMLGNHAVAFADSNPAKVGKSKCGLEIMSFQKAVESVGDSCFLIAIAAEHIYEMIVQLRKAGIMEYSVFSL